jgi:hypothetical protein
MIVYADQSTYRTALLMKVAEEQHLYKNRKVVYLSESPYSRHLMKLGFLNYQPEDSYHPADIDVIISNIAAGNSIIFNTFRIGNKMLKQEALRLLIEGLLSPAINLDEITLIIENVVVFYARQRNRGSHSGMDLFNDFLQTARDLRMPVALAAHSSEEIPKEIANNCSYIVVGKIDQPARSLHTSYSVCPQLRAYFQHSNGVPNLCSKDFFVYKFHSPIREVLSDELKEKLSEEEFEKICTGYERFSAKPFFIIKLEQKELKCGFDPENPNRGPEYKSEDQDRFNSELEEARDEEDEVSEESEENEDFKRLEQAQKKSYAILNSGKKNVITTSFNNTKPVANDNISLKKKVAASSQNRRLFAKVNYSSGIGRNNLVKIGLPALNATPAKLYNAPKRQSDKKLAENLNKNRKLKEAVREGMKYARLHSEPGISISAVAVTAVLYKALRSKMNFPYAFLQNIDLMQIKTLAAAGDTVQSADAQYKYMLSVWMDYNENPSVKTKTLKKAA